MSYSSAFLAKQIRKKHSWKENQPTLYRAITISDKTLEKTFTQTIIRNENFSKIISDRFLAIKHSRQCTAESVTNFKKYSLML